MKQLKRLRMRSNQLLIALGLLSYISIIPAAAQVQPSTQETKAVTNQTIDSTLVRLARFVKNVEVFNYLYPQEKVFLHFDNTGYFMGETIWFKAYIVNSTTNQYTGLSKVLYVELVSPEGRIMDSQKLKIENGQCAGQFSLTNLIHAGFYEIRAYTRMMLNWDSELIFSRVFPVFNYPQQEGKGMYESPKMNLLPRSQRLPDLRPQAPKQKNINITFFPEGGNLVEGLCSNVSFKATDEQGHALDVTGTIYDSQKEIVATLKTFYNGMGKFIFTPIKGETYKAEIVSGKDSQTFSLPAIAPQGYVMSMNTMQKDFIILQLVRNEQTDTRSLGLSVMCRGKVVLFKQIKWENEYESLIKISKADFPAGVNQFTLFDEKGHIYAQRLVFIHPSNEVIFSYTPNKKELSGKDAIEINFKLTDRNNQPVETTFSLSVRDTDTETPHNNNFSNIQNNLLLGSELRGFIENIGYYFEANDLSHRSALDLLLTTQGWTRYEWEPMTRPIDFEIKQPIEEGIMVMGELKSTFRKRPKENAEIKIWIMNETGNYQKGSCFTDSIGKFAFVAEDFEGRWQMNIQTKEKDKRKEMNIILDKAFAPKARAYSPAETEFFKQKDNTAINSEISDSTANDNSSSNTMHSLENLLPTVKIKADKPWQSKFIMKWNNIIYDLDNERERMDDTGEKYLQPFYEWLEENNSYFNYVLEADSISARYKGRPVHFLSNRGDAPTWLDANGGVNIDMEQLTINDLDAISISDKPGVALVLSPNIVQEPDSNISAERLVVITLFIKKEYFSRKDRKGERLSQLQGFSPTRIFYMPDYRYAGLPAEQDYRRTLYWNPNVKTNVNGEANVKFYNTESCRKIKISTATVTPGGLLGSLDTE